jgi:hypothetical protein
MENTSTEPRIAALSVALERALLAEIRRSYDALNATFFSWQLRCPLFELTEPGGRLGRWVAGARSIELSRALLSNHDWGTLIEILKHEMAHQYVHEVLGVPDESAHGPTFRTVCAERGIDARAAGLPARAFGFGRPDGAGPDGAAAGGEQAKVLERVAKLFALAESANEHEAQVATSAAQRLMLKYNIDAALRGSGAEARYSFVHLGKPTGRVQESQRLLAVILHEHFFVQIIWVSIWRPFEGKRGRVIEACGTPENLELAAYVHDFLTHTAERLWVDHRRRGGAVPNRERRYFVAGVMAGFRDKLEAERRRNGEAGLVWVGDADLERYFKRRHPRIRWDSHTVGLGRQAYAHGRNAGRKIVLHRGISAGPSGGVRLLPAGRK